MRRNAYVISCIYCLLILFTIYSFYLFIIFFSFDTIFDWLTPLSAMSSWGGPHTNHHNVYIFCPSFVFRGFVHMYIVFFEFLNCSPPPHTVNMGLSLEVHGALVLFW